MHPIAPSTLLTALKFRYATKSFDPARSVPAEVIAALEESLVLTPSSFGLQPWKFILVVDRELRARLLPHSWNQKQIVECSHLVVFARKDKLGREEIHRYVESIAATTGAPESSLEGYKGMMSGFVARHPDIDRWASNQVYIALGQFMAACALLGVDACPMEGIDPAKYDGTLGLTGSGYSTVVVCPIGYRSPDDKYAHAPKVRFPAGKLIDRR